MLVLGFIDVPLVCGGPSSIQRPKKTLIRKGSKKNERLWKEKLMSSSQMKPLFYIVEPDFKQMISLYEDDT
jgi:hypothetical protein